MSSVRRRVAAALESGRYRSRLSRRLSHYWESAADPVRPVRLPPGVRVVGIGGATLGGAGKTPVTRELSLQLSRRGLRVSVVAPGYRVRGEARHVVPCDPVGRVGDEALELTRALDPIAVYVGQRRAESIAAAAEHADVVVVDSLLQTRPVRLALSILVLDLAAPWGSGRCVPAGDLRADPRRLLSACDVVLLGRNGPGTPGLLPERLELHGFSDDRLNDHELDDLALNNPELDDPVAMLSEEAARRARSGSALRAFSFYRHLVSVHCSNTGLKQPIDALRGRALGLAVSVARPGRVLSALHRHGIYPLRVLYGADHYGVTAELARAAERPPDVEAWLTTPKDWEHLRSLRLRRPIWVLQEQIRLPEALGHSIWPDVGSQ